VRCVVKRPAAGQARRRRRLAARRDRGDPPREGGSPRPLGHWRSVHRCHPARKQPSRARGQPKAPGRVRHRNRFGNGPAQGLLSNLQVMEARLADFGRYHSKHSTFAPRRNRVDLLLTTTYRMGRQVLCAAGRKGRRTSCRFESSRRLRRSIPYSKPAHPGRSQSHRG
jgi:hypothetical protein